MIVHDLRCTRCDFIQWNVPTEVGKYGKCICGGALAVTWEGGKPPATDVYGVAEFNRGLGCEVTSTREAERIARRRGWEPCADRVHGAEYAPEPKERRKPTVKHERRSRHGASAKFENVAA